MHHKKNNNIHSTDNHDNPQHQKPNYPSRPAPQKYGKSVLTRIRERFKEKPVTPEELKELKMKAQKETYKTQIARAKNARPSRLDSIIGSGKSSGRRTSSDPLGGGSWLLGSSEEPSLSFITGVDNRKSRTKEPTIGKGLTDLF